MIQEHHARSLHWDFRLERDGVLVSWAVPKNLPPSPRTNHLAVHTEDHPLDYGDFEGEIPAGEYGAGKVSVWDRGTYDTEKWTDREVKVVLHGRRVVGRYVLFRTDGRNWMVHRMDPPSDPEFEPPPARVRPMAATEGHRLPSGEQDRGWGYEFWWDGRRVVVFVSGGRAEVRNGRAQDVTRRHPELRPIGPALGSTDAVLDGELVALDRDGRPSRSRLRSGRGSVTFVIYDLLYHVGRSTMALPYRERRTLLDGLGLSGPSFQVTPWWAGGGARVRRAAREQGLPGVVAKRLDSPYQPGRASSHWRRFRVD